MFQNCIRNFISKTIKCASDRTDSFVSEANVPLSFSPAPTDPQTCACGPSDLRPQTRARRPADPHPRSRARGPTVPHVPFPVDHSVPYVWEYSWGLWLV